MNLFETAIGALPARSARDPECEAAWNRLTPFKPDRPGLRRKRIVTLDRSDPAHGPFDMLRTQILQAMRPRGWRSIAITSPTPGCGKTLTSLNLAFSFARQRRARIALVELDLRRPSLAKLLSVAPPRCVSEMLAGDARPEEAMLRVGDGLALALARGPAEDPAELLHDEAALEALTAMTDALDPEIVIYDLPPMLAADDAEAFLPSADCAMLIAAANESKTRDVEVAAARAEALTELFGVALNKSEFTPKSYYGYGY